MVDVVKLDPAVFEEGVVWMSDTGDMVILRTATAWRLYAAVNGIPKGDHLAELRSQKQLANRWCGDLNNWVWGIREKRCSVIDSEISRLSLEIGKLKDERSIWKTCCPSGSRQRI